MSQNFHMTDLLHLCRTDRARFVFVLEHGVQLADVESLDEIPYIYSGIAGV